MKSEEWVGDTKMIKCWNRTRKMRKMRKMIEIVFYKMRIVLVILSNAHRFQHFVFFSQIFFSFKTFSYIRYNLYKRGERVEGVMVFYFTWVRPKFQFDLNHRCTSLFPTKLKRFNISCNKVRSNRSQIEAFSNENVESDILNSLAAEYLIFNRVFLSVIFFSKRYFTSRNCCLFCGITYANNFAYGIPYLVTVVT